MTNVLPPLRDPTTMGAVLASRKKAKFPLSTWGGVREMVTSYSIDYGEKDVKPSKPRPCSNTRRNRPHPSKVNTTFLNAKLLTSYFLDKTRDKLFKFFYITKIHILHPRHHQKQPRILEYDSLLKVRQFSSVNYGEQWFKSCFQFTILCLSLIAFHALEGSFKAHPRWRKMLCHGAKRIRISHHFAELLRRVQRKL